MSWYGNTLIPVVQDCFFDCESFPACPDEVAAAVSKSDPKVGEYIRRTYTKATITNLYELCGLVERREQVERRNTCWK